MNPVLCVFEKLTYKVAKFHKNMDEFVRLWWRYSLSFPCDTLILCMITPCLKVNPVGELRESCPVRF